MKRILVVLLVAAALASCSSNQHDATGTTTTTTTAAASVAATGSSSGASDSEDQDSPQAIFAHGYPPPGSGGTCDGHTPGQGKILITYCHGTAQIEFHLPSGPRLVTGGVCWMNGTSLELDWGTATGEGFTGPMPDYFTLLMPSSPGPIDGSVGMFAFAGKPSYFPTMYGVIGAQLNPSLPILPAQVHEVKGDFSGGAWASSLTFQATFNCDGKPGPFPSLGEIIKRGQTAVSIPAN